MAASLFACTTLRPEINQPTATPLPLIDLTFKDLEGSEVKLSSLRGQVVLLNFWAGWCSPCKDEMPVLEAFYQENKDKGFTVVAVNVSESAAEAKAFISEHGYTFLVLSDPPGNGMIDLGLNGLPASLVINAEGRRELIWIGPWNEEYLDQLVLPLLKAEP